MPTHELFLEMICAHPDDDGPRLVYADWLEENGETDRAEFIRAQITLAKMEEYDPDYDRLWDRQNELLKANQSRWLGQLPNFGKDWPIPDGAWQFWRGFPWRGRVSLHLLVDHDDAIFRLAPIQGLQLMRQIGPELFRSAEQGGASIFSMTPLSDLERVAANPNLKQLIELDLSGLRLGPAGTKAVLTSPHLLQLQSLFLGGQDVSDGVAGAIAASPIPPRLESLYFYGSSESDFSDKGMQSLASSAALSGLRLLHLGEIRPGVTAEGVRSLAASRTLTRLTHLMIECGVKGRSIATVQAEGAAAIAQSPNFADLTSLELSHQDLGDEGAQAIANSPQLQKLHALYLRWNDIGDAGIAALASSPCLRPVSCLDLERNQIGAAGMAALAESTHVRSLRTLRLNSNRIGDGGLTALIQSPWMRSVQYLDIRSNGIGEEGFLALGQSRNVANLKSLWIYEPKISPVAVQALASSPYLAGLTELRLKQDEYDPGMADALLRAPFLANIRTLQIGLRRRLQDAVRKIRARFGDCVS